MPLDITRKEIAAIPALLSNIAQDSAIFADISLLSLADLQQVILVGSGDSLAISMIAAAYIERETTIICRAIQTLDFLGMKTTCFNVSTLIIVISASGRMSPIVSALKHAESTTAQVISISNCGNTVFSSAGKKMIFTGAQKFGLPTQSTSASLLALFTIFDAIKAACGTCLNTANLDSRKKTTALQNMSSETQATIFAAQRFWQQQNKAEYFSKRIIFLGSGVTLGLAYLGINLLSCGPQINANYYSLEEYHHALRLNQANSNDIVIIFPENQFTQAINQQTINTLIKQGADVITINNRITHLTTDTHSLHNFEYVSADKNSLLSSLSFLYEMALQLGEYYLLQGGERVVFLE